MNIGQKIRTSDSFRVGTFESWSTVEVDEEEVEVGSGEEVEGEGEVEVGSGEEVEVEDLRRVEVLVELSLRVLLLL